MKEKTIGIIIVLIAFFIGSYNVLSKTNFAIQDTDPTAYVIVVLLMAFVMLLFSVKEELALNRDRRNLLYGALILIAYVFLVSYLRLSLSFLYYSYRIDALLLPVLLSGIIIAVFGLDGIWRLKKQVVYALFASPLLLAPVISANTKFVNAVAYITYWLMELVKEPVVRNGIVITAPSSYSISIASTCADLGAFIAILLFLIPVVYFYDGKLKNKACWVASGVSLFFLFNISRMFAIATVWVYSGIGKAASLFHIFAGQILFYIAIIVMLLIASRMGLSLPKGRQGKVSGRRQDRAHAKPAIAFALGTALAIGILGFIFTLPYRSVAYSPFTSLNATAPDNATVLYRTVVTPLEQAGMNISVLRSGNDSALIAMSNASFNRTNPLYVIAVVENGRAPYGIISNYTRAVSGSSILLSNGRAINSAAVYSDGYLFYVNYFLVPYYVFGSGYVINYELFYELNSSISINLRDVCEAYTGPINGIESQLYNLVKLQNFSNKVMCASLKVG